MAEGVQGVQDSSSSGWVYESSASYVVLASGGAFGVFEGSGLRGERL